MIMQTPNWSYGKKRDFGPLFKSAKNDKIIVKFNKGVFFLRSVDFNYRIEKVEVSEGSSDNDEKVYFKTAIKPSVVVTEPCGACLSISDFPMYVFVSGDGKVLYTTETMKAFKSFASTSIDGIQSADSSLSADDYSMSEPSEKLYTETDDVTLKNTAIALLIPVMCIEASKRKNGSIIIDSVMDIRPYDYYKYTKNDELEDPESSGKESGSGTEPDNSGTGKGCCDDADKNGGNNGTAEKGNASSDGSNEPSGGSSDQGEAYGAGDCGGKDGTGTDSSTSSASSTANGTTNGTTESSANQTNSGNSSSNTSIEKSSETATQDKAKQRAVDENSDGSYADAIASLFASGFVKE